MLFNSYSFLFVFLPIVLGLFFALGRPGDRRAATVCLLASSLVFYGWWNYRFLLLLVVSILFNWFVGETISKRTPPERPAGQKPLLVLGIVVNLFFLGYFKYTNFFIQNVTAFFNTRSPLYDIILPLGISFFTFTQIKYLVDAYRGQAKPYPFLQYSLFVTFFPHLVAGPILDHKSIIPQFADKKFVLFRADHMAKGLTLFFLGLLKKALLADQMAIYATNVFDASAMGVIFTFFEAWVGALSYTLQIYFDFSGYSDMAIGLALMFNIKFPINFFSPYKAVNVIDFWRRWHITLSHFLRDYLYIPLGGNRKGVVRQNLNLFVTMFLGGLWHGAAWTFVIWGSLHGVFLAINHGWRSLRQRLGHDVEHSSRPGRFLSRMVTLVAVIGAWVFFRAADLETAFRVLKGMAGIHGVSLPRGMAENSPFLAKWGFLFNGLTPTLGISPSTMTFYISVALVIALFGPNTMEIINNDGPTRSPVGEKFFHWRPSPRWAVLIGVGAAFSVMALSQVSEFIYFQF